MNQEIVTKKCSKCQEVKSIIEFHKDRKQNDGVSYYCKTCRISINNRWETANKESRKLYFKVYRDSHKTEAKTYHKKYYIENTEQYKAHDKKYYSDNKSQIIKRNTKHKIERCRTDLPFRIASNYRSRVCSAIKNNQKSGHTLVLLGCNILTLKLYLESKFKDNMSWDNYGYGNDKWHIDHIIPCASFDLTDTEEQKKCFHYTNLQPLWQHENFIKGSKLV